MFVRSKDNYWPDRTGDPNAYGISPAPCLVDALMCSSAKCNLSVLLGVSRRLSLALVVKHFPSKEQPLALLLLLVYIYIYIHTLYVCIHIYIYIYREREREREIPRAVPSDVLEAAAVA